MNRDAPSAVEEVLLAMTQVRTFRGSQALTGASGFFFRDGERLFIVTNRHVFADEPTNHFPDRIEIEVHTDAQNMTRYAVQSLPLYCDGMSVWRDAKDSAGPVDIAVLEVDESKLADGAVTRAFVARDLEARGESVMVGDALAVIGYPLGFQDTVHHLPVARSASVASAYGVRFQEQGYFLTDARTHRGSSGSPVLRRRTVEQPGEARCQWQLLGVHSTRMDMSSRDDEQDESLGLNCAWYADILTVLTTPRARG